MNTSQLTVLQIIIQNLNQYLVLAIRMSFFKKKNTMIYRNQTQSHPARKHFHNRDKSYLQQMHLKQELVINAFLSALLATLSSSTALMDHLQISL